MLYRHLRRNLSFLNQLFSLPNEFHPGWLTVRHLRSAADGSPVARLTDILLRQALDRGAVERHLLPTSEGVRLHWTDADGETRSLLPIPDGTDPVRETLPKPVQQPLMVRLRYLARVDLTLRGAALKGCIPLSYGSNDYAVTATFTPTDEGEEAVTLQFRPSRWGLTDGNAALSR